MSSSFCLRTCSDNSAFPVNLEITNENVFQLLLPVQYLLRSMMDPFENFKGTSERDEQLCNEVLVKPTLSQ